MKVYVVRIDRQHVMHDDYWDGYFSHAWAGIFDSNDKACECRQELIMNYLKARETDDPPLERIGKEHLNEGVEIIEYELNEVLMKDF